MHSTVRTSKTAGHLPGEPGIWVMIWGDLAIFSLLFGLFALYRRDDVALFDRSQAALGQAIGIVNTLLLLTSSWLVARAVRQLRAEDRTAAARGVLFALICAGLFLANKAVEWTMLIGDGRTLRSNDFFMFFFMMTGIHAFHVVIGMGVLVYMRVRIRDCSANPVTELMAVESCASFWHLVDLLWIVLFALLYVAR